MTPPGETRILTVNAGSASVRLALFDARGSTLRPIARLKLEGDAAEPGAGLARFLGAEGGMGPIAAVAHRVVHGGAGLVGPSPIDAGALAAIEEALPLAPLHNASALAWIGECRVALGDAFAIAVPDTGYFADLPDTSRRYALPRDLSERLGLRRYGFHGIAHQAMAVAWAADRAAAERGMDRIITLQLGSGCSIAAIRGGRPIDVSMGFTPLEGLVMATRSGDLDPGLIIHLMRVEGLDANALDRLLNHQSGLRGLAGTGDMRALEAAGTPEAEAAIAFYAVRIRKYIGAYLALLGGAEGILFGGGVGENSARVRRLALEGMEWAGIVLDPVANDATAPARLDAPSSRVAIHTIAVDEARIMAEAALALLPEERPRG